MKLRIVLIVFMATICSLSAYAQDALDKGRRIISETNRELRVSQETIDRADEKTLEMLGEYKAARKEIDNYNIYNGQLRDLIASQVEEMRLLADDIDEIASTGRRVMPFMQEMIDGLSEFVDSDYPFLPEERRTRIEQLNADMKRADVSVAAKFRQILEAYQIEIDYGNTMEAYEGDLEGRKAVFLKIGRIGLYYLSLDNQHCGAWDMAIKQWQVLEDIDYRLAIAKAIGIAKKQRSPELFVTAVAPAEER